MSAVPHGMPRTSPSATTARMLAAERVIGRLLIAVTYVSVALLVIGVVVMVTNGISPMSGGPALDLESIGRAVAGLQPAGFLWLGLIAVVAAPIARVIAAAIAYARDADWLMVGVSVGILVVIAVGVVSALTATV